MEDSSLGKVTPENGGEGNFPEEKPKGTPEKGKLSQDDENFCSTIKDKDQKDHPVKMGEQETMEQVPETLKLKEERENKEQIQIDQQNTEMLQLLDTIKQLRDELEHKDSIVKLNERERSILEKEKTSVS